MHRAQLKLLAAIAVIAGSVSHNLWAGDRLVITFPGRSRFTLVQRLNRQGVEAVKKHQYEKAEVLFYKAYLYDPGDPFTLNNLGYVSELQGQLDRAHNFYTLASEQGSNATIDETNAKPLEGRPMRYAFESLQDVPMRVNRMNVNAMRLLSEDRGLAAAALLQEARTLSPKNPFTLNNLGVAYEAIGDYERALKFYVEVVASHSSEPVVIARDKSWRGRPISEMASESASRLHERLQKMNPGRGNAMLFAMHGVFASNQNDWATARQDFLQAYSLDSESGFSLNNRGYVAEKDGDLETAHFFYDKARKASDSKNRVGLATERSAEGKNLSVVAKYSNEKVNTEIDKYSQERHRQTGPVELIPRANAPAGDFSLPSSVPPVAHPSSVPQSPRSFE
jgi:Flp pilus assembly protein TadD